MEDSILSEEENVELNKVQTNKKSLIEFSKINKYYLILFICPIISTISGYLTHRINKLGETKQLYFFIL